MSYDEYRTAYDRNIEEVIYQLWLEPDATETLQETLGLARHEMKCRDCGEYADWWVSEIRTEAGYEEGDDGRVNSFFCDDCIPEPVVELWAYWPWSDPDALDRDILGVDFGTDHYDDESMLHVPSEMSPRSYFAIIDVANRWDIPLHEAETFLSWIGFFDAEVEDEVGATNDLDAADPIVITDDVAREQLREHGEVVMFRESERPTGQMVWRESPTGPTQGTVLVDHVQEMDRELQWVDGELLKRSGFETYDDWKAAIREQHGWEPPGGHLHRVRSVLPTDEPGELLDDLTGRDNERLRLERSGGDFHVPGDTLGFINKTAVLGGGPDHFVIQFHHHSRTHIPGPARQVIDRSSAEKFVRYWAAIEFEEIKPSDSHDLVPPDWVAEYDADWFGSRDLQPTPADWELVSVDEGTVEWQRPPRPPRDDEYWEENDTWRPENVAQKTSVFTHESEYGMIDGRITNLDVDYQPVMKIEDGHRQDLQATIAEILARVARGKPYDDVEPSTGTVLETSRDTIPSEDPTTLDEYLAEIDFDDEEAEEGA